MNKHTPAPWHIQGDHGKLWIETSGNDDTIAEVHRRKSKGSVYSCAEASANAKLIAAAPDLLEALEQAVTSMQDSGYPNSHVAVRAARQAIARARGEA